MSGQDGVDRGLRRLEAELRAARRFGARATRQMHAVVLADLRRAEQRAQRAERRVRRLEKELAEVRASATWRAGRAVVALPARVRRWRS